MRGATICAAALQNLTSDITTARRLVWKIKSGPTKPSGVSSAENGEAFNRALDKIAPKP